ncbi:hypothetical protein ACLB1E_06310 [Escherichia coli]
MLASASFLNSFLKLQSDETKNASWANLTGAIVGSAINATGAVVMAGAECKPAGKIDDITRKQEQNTDKPDDQPRLKWQKKSGKCENQTCRNRNTTKRIINEPKY